MMRKTIFAVLLMWLGVVGLSTQVAAAGTIQYDVKFWSSKGQTDWNHDASFLSPLLGNPTSELFYKDVDSNILELTIKADLKSDRFIRGGFGFGTIDDGVLVGDDYLSAAGAVFFGSTVTGPHRVSRTRSDITGDDLKYFNIEYGKKFSRTPDAKWRWEIFGGYRRWTEKYVAKGLRQIECTAPGTFCSPVGFTGFAGQKVISNEVTWDFFFIGGYGEYRFNPKFSLNGSLIISPLVNMDNEDIHHLRTDLQQSPSFSMDGRGNAFLLEFGTLYRFNKRLALNAGYRYWKVRVTDGDWKVHPVSGPAISADLNELKTVRKGITIGLTINTK